MIFENYEELKNKFINDEIDNLLSTIEIDFENFHYQSTSLESRSLYIIYENDNKILKLEWKQIDNDENLLGTIIPANISLTEKEQSISLEEDIIIVGINNEQPFKAKIDTGADLCSLHAEDINIDGNYVKFCINDKHYKMICHDKVQIQNSESVEVRPIVKFNINFADQAVNNVLFNLNDRTNMDHPVLIGTNLLKEVDFIIDVNENVDNNEQSTESVTYNEDRESQLR